MVKNKSSNSAAQSPPESNSENVTDLKILYIFLLCGKQKSSSRESSSWLWLRILGLQKKTMKIIQLKCLCSRSHWIFILCWKRVSSCHTGTASSCLSCWADEAQGQSPHWQHPDFMATELETAFLKYKWRLVTVLIDGALLQQRAKINVCHAESYDWGAEEWCLWYLWSRPPPPRAHS